MFVQIRNLINEIEVDSTAVDSREWRAASVFRHSIVSKSFVLRSCKCGSMLSGPLFSSACVEGHESDGDGRLCLMRTGNDFLFYFCQQQASDTHLSGQIGFEPSHFQVDCGVDLELGFLPMRLLLRLLYGYCFLRHSDTLYCIYWYKKCK